MRETLDDGSTLAYPAEPLDIESMSIDEQADMMRQVALAARMR